MKKRSSALKGQINRHNLRGDGGRFAPKPGAIAQRKNGQNKIDPRSTVPLPLTSLKRRTTRATQFNWILPMVGAVTPQYLEMILRGALAGNHIQQYQLFELMIDNWPELAGCVQELTYGVTRREIIFDPYTEEDEQPTPSAIEKTKLVSALLRKMRPNIEEDENGLKNTVRDLLDGWFRGFVVCEIMWDTIDTGRTGMATGPRATAWVQPQTYGFNQLGVLGYNTAQPMWDTSVSMYSAPSQVQLDPFPENKFLIGIHKVKSGTPLGGPMLRALAWWWCAANFSSDWLLNLAQVFGLPFRWASYPSSAPDETVNAICDMLANMGSAGWGAFPVGTTLELKDPVRAAGESPQGALLDRADRYARSLILGQTMSGRTMLTSGRGGQAFGTVEAQLKQDRLEAASEYVADIFNEQLIPMILQLNYGDIEECPVCRFLQNNEGTYQDAQRDQILVNVGVPIPTSHMRKKYSIPEPEGDEEILQPPAGVKAPPPGAAAGQEIPLPEKASMGQPVTEQQEQRQAKQQSEQEKAQAETQKKLASGLERISRIKDDALFAREFKRLTSALVTLGLTTTGALSCYSEDAHRASAISRIKGAAEPYRDPQNGDTSPPTGLGDEHWITVDGRHILISEGDRQSTFRTDKEGWQGWSKTEEDNKATQLAQEKFGKKYYAHTDREWTKGKPHTYSIGYTRLGKKYWAGQRVLTTEKFRSDKSMADVLQKAGLIHHAVKAGSIKGAAAAEQGHWITLGDGRHIYISDKFSAGDKVMANGSSDGKFTGSTEAKIVNPHSNAAEVARVDERGRMSDKQGHTHLAKATVEVDRSKRGLPPLNFEAYHHQLSKI